MDRKVKTELSATGSRFARLYGIKHDSYCPIIRGACNPKCVFHKAVWYNADEYLRFDDDGDLLVPDELVESVEMFIEDEDILRSCQILDIVGGLHFLLGRHDVADDDLITLVSDMATRSWSLDTYEQNTGRVLCYED